MARSIFAIFAVATLFAAGSLAQNSTTSSTSSTTALTDNGFGRCGSLANGAGCADPSHCCSKFGFCGVGLDTINNIEYCGEGCQGGSCKSGPIQLGAPVAGATSPQPSTPTTPLTPTTPTPKPPTVPPTNTTKTAPLSSAGSLSVSAVKVAAGVVVAGSLARFA